MDIIDRLHREESTQRQVPVKISLYWVVVEGIGKVHQGRDHNHATRIYREYCTCSRQPTGSLAGLDVTLVKDGVETDCYFAPRPYPKG